MKPSEKKIAELIKFLEAKDLESFTQSAGELYVKMIEWLREDNPSRHDIEKMYYLVTGVISQLKKVREKMEGDISLTQGTYLDIDDLTFYY